MLTITQTNVRIHIRFADAHVMENLSVETQRSRAKVVIGLIDLYGWLVPGRQLALNPRWLHILRPEQSNSSLSHNDGWEGPLAAMKRQLRLTRKDLTDRMRESDQDINSRLDKMSRELDSKTESILRALAALAENNTRHQRLSVQL